MRYQRGQTVVEYAVIGVLVVVFLAAVAGGLQRLLKENVEATQSGLNTESVLPK